MNFALTKLTKKKELAYFSSKDFIPAEPYSKFCFNYDELNIERLTCVAKFGSLSKSMNSMNSKKSKKSKSMDKIYYCPKNCKIGNQIHSNKGLKGSNLLKDVTTNKI